MSNPNPIPPMFAGSSKIHKKSNNSLLAQIKALQVNEYITLPLAKRSSVGWTARKLGYKVATRQMGSPDTFRCYRVE